MNTCYAVVMNEQVRVYQVRLPVKMYDELVRLKETEGRSLHWAIIRSLELGLPEATAEAERRSAARSSP